MAILVLGSEKKEQRRSGSRVCLTSMSIAGHATAEAVEGERRREGPRHRCLSLGLSVVCRHVTSSIIGRLRALRLVRLRHSQG
jgi:hypothetical protein